jgi:hypothetical protein
MLRSKTIIKGLWKLGAVFMVILILSGTSQACRMYGVISNDLPEDLLQDHLIDDPNSLWALSLSNDDGWGIAYYPAYGAPAVIKRGANTLSVSCSGCLIDDPTYDDVVEGINALEPKITVAHIRNCVTGCCDNGGYTIANPHPFYREKNEKTWTFAHNGVVSKTRMYKLLGDYLKANPPNGSDILPACDPSDRALVVDTELYFLYVLKKIEENGWHAVNGIVEAVTSMIDDGESGGMNFIMSDGHTVWGFRKGLSLEYLDEYLNGYSAVASQKPGSDGNWIVMSDYDLVVLSHDAPPVVMDVRNHPENYIADAAFNNSSVDIDLRTDGPGQDWYESRNDDPILLTIDETDVGGNATKKAKLTADSSKNAYLTQEFAIPQTGTFTVQWEIYVDTILDDDNRDRGAIMMIGDDSDSGGNPNSSSDERYVFMAFWAPGGGGAPTDTMTLIAREPGDTYGVSSTWKSIVSGLNFDTWYNIKVICDVAAGTYDVYVNNVLAAAGVDSYSGASSLTHISFAQWDDGAGTFYVDNIMADTLTDAAFNDSTADVDLRADSAGQDWYESHGDDPMLVTMDETFVGGNTTKKVKLNGNGLSSTYVSQEFSKSQMGAFPIQWQIYVDEIISGSGPNRTAYMFMGDEGSIGGPNASDENRFVYMAFYKEGGGSTGSMDLVARQPGDGWDNGEFTPIARCLNLDQWYTVKVDVDIPNNSYDVYVDGVSVGIDIQAYTPKSSLTHLSFATLQGNNGTFYVDNVMEDSETLSCLEDIDKDGEVNASDLAIFAENFGETGNGDFNFDCDVDGSDLSIFVDAIDSTCP